MEQKYKTFRELIGEHEWPEITYMIGAILNSGLFLIGVWAEPLAIFAVLYLAVILYLLSSAYLLLHFRVAGWCMAIVALVWITLTCFLLLVQQPQGNAFVLILFFAAVLLSGAFMKRKSVIEERTDIKSNEDELMI